MKKNGFILIDILVGLSIFSVIMISAYFYLLKLKNMQNFLKTYDNRLYEARNIFEEILAGKNVNNNNLKMKFYDKGLVKYIYYFSDKKYWELVVEK